MVQPNSRAWQATPRIDGPPRLKFLSLGGDELLTGGEHLHPPDLLRERGDGDEVLRLEEGDRLLGERLVDI